MLPHHCFVCAFAFATCVERAVSFPDDADEEGLCPVSMLQMGHQLTQTPDVTRRVPEMASFAHARGLNDSAELRQLQLLAGPPNREPQREEGKSELSLPARIGKMSKSPPVKSPVSAKFRQLQLLAGPPNREPQREEGNLELSQPARIGKTSKSPPLKSNDSAKLRELQLLAGPPTRELQSKSPPLMEPSRRFAGYRDWDWVTSGYTESWDWNPEVLTVVNIAVFLVIAGALISLGVCFFLHRSDGAQQFSQEAAFDDRAPAESFQQQGYARQNNEDEWNQRQRVSRDVPCC